MPTPFSVESTTPGSIVWTVDGSGNTQQAGTMTAVASALGTLVGVPVQPSGGGVTSSLSANVLTPTFGVSAASGTQLSDTTRDYMVYLTTTAGGANNTLTIGNNSTATTATISANATVGTGQLWSFRLPAGWYVRSQGAVAIGVQSAISC